MMSDKKRNTPMAGERRAKGAKRDPIQNQAKYDWHNRPNKARLGPFSAIISGRDRAGTER